MGSADATGRPTQAFGMDCVVQRVVPSPAGANVSLRSGKKSLRFGIKIAFFQVKYQIEVIGYFLPNVELSPECLGFICKYQRAEHILKGVCFFSFFFFLS